MKLKPGSWFAAVALLAGAALAQAAESTWISAQDAMRTITAGNVIVLDARDAKAYADGHVEGALSTPWQSLSDMAGKPGQPRWGTLLPADQLGVALGKLGINEKSRVLVYAAPPKGWGEDGRVAWTLRAAGVTRVQIIDGGIEAWRAAGGKTTRAVPTPTPVAFNVGTLDTSLDATREEVKAALGRARIVDAREPEEFNGARKFGEARGGHLPGATLLPWNRVFDAQGRLQNPDAIRKLLLEAGIRPEDEVIAYCTKGIRSAHLALVLRELGYSKARNYDASFYEWAGDASLPLNQ